MASPQENPIHRAGMTNGLTDRQLFALEYMQFTKKIVRKTELSQEGEIYSLNLFGHAKKIPEIAMLHLDSAGHQSPVVYHNVRSFVITHNKSKKQLDLVTITPREWSQKVINLISPRYKPPETHIAFKDYQVLDDIRKECVVNDAVENGDVDMIVTSGIWNTLIARFLQEIGQPANGKAVDFMRSCVEQRRQEIFDALEGKGDVDPQEIGLRNFSEINGT